MGTEQQSSGLISVERAVAFVGGPIVGAAGGLLSVVAAKWGGIHVTQEAAAGVFMTGIAGGTATAYKWLDTRGKAWLQEEAKRLGWAPKIDNVLGEVKKDVPQSIQKEAETKLREEFQELGNKLHADFEQKLAGVKAAASRMASETELKAAPAPVVPPIPTAPNDPAPPTPPPTAPVAQQSTVADQGAAPQQ